MALTEQQIKYREALLKKRKAKQSELAAPVTEGLKHAMFLEDKIMYLQNCIFWINEFREGRSSSIELKKAIKAVRRHCWEMEDEILNNQN